MGFMAGFGPAFSEGVKRNQELREQRKDDAFKLTFAEMSKRRDQYAADKKEDQALVRKAKAFAEMKDPSLWPKVYEWAKAGLSDKQIEDNMNGTFNTGTEGASKVSPIATPAVPGSDTATPPAATALSAPVAAEPQAAPEDQTASVEPLNHSQNDKLLTGKSGKFKTGAIPVRPQAAPEDQLVAAPSVAPAPMAAKPESGVHKFMRDAFGNGSGEQSRTDAMTEAKGSIAKSLGIDEKEFGTYNTEAPDAANIRWTPAKAAAEPDKINTLEEAQIELDNARATNSPEHIAVAERRVNSIIQAGKIKAEQAAAAQGLTAEGTYVNVFGDPLPGTKEPVWKGTVKVTEGQDGQLVDAEGNTVDSHRVRKMDKREWTERDNLNTRASKEVQDYRTALDNHVGFIAGVGALDKTYRDNPNALQKYSTAAASMAQDAANEVKAGVDLLARSTDQEYSAEFAIGTLEKQAEVLQQRVDSADNAISRQANAGALAETQKALLTYRLAATLGQTGRNLAETERKMIGQGFDASNYPQFRAKVASLLKQSNDTMERQANTVRAQTEGFKKQFGYVPYEVQVETPKERLMNVTEKTDPDLFNGKQILEGTPTAIVEGEGKTSEQTPPAPTEAPTAPAQPEGPAGPAPIGTRATNAQGQVLIKTTNGWVPVPK